MKNYLDPEVKDGNGVAETGTVPETTSQPEPPTETAEGDE